MVPRDYPSINDTDTDSTKENDTCTNNCNNGTDENVEADVMEKFDVAKDSIGAKYMKVENSLCFLENSVFVAEPNKPEVK